MTFPFASTVLSSCSACLPCFGRCFRALVADVDDCFSLHLFLCGSFVCFVLLFVYCCCLLEQAQNSMPDVIIWMLTNKKRLAFARIPAHEVLYAHHADGSKWMEACGKNCGKPQTVYLKVSILLGCNEQCFEQGYLLPVCRKAGKCSYLK